jgi:hypothetical protein
MATNRSGHQPGGGIASRTVRHTTAPKVEPRPHARNPAKVAQYGQLVGNHATNTRGATNYKGEPDFTRRGYSPPVGPTSFNNVGPGGGRTVMKSGSQCQTGTPAQGEGGLPSTKGQWPD